MFFLIVLGAWLAGVVVSYAYGNRKMPTVVLLLGLALIGATYGGYLGGGFGLAGLALLAAIQWVANKAEDLR